jgi:flagellar biogenesis protein FliO
MTRDGSVATPAAEPATLNPLAQIARMVGALLIVLLLVYIAVLMLKKYRGAALAAQGEPSAGPPPGRPQAARSIADLLAAPSVSPSPQRTTQSTLAGLDVVSMKELPGSGAMVYLIKAANRLILVGATTHGGVRTLSEWDIEETRTVEEQNASFDAYLRAQGVLPETPPEMSDIAAVRSRLHEAAARLSRKIETGIESDSETIAR